MIDVSTSSEHNERQANPDVAAQPPDVTALHERLSWLEATDLQLAHAWTAGYLTAVQETIGHTRQILSPIAWEALYDRLSERAEKHARSWVLTHPSRDR